MITTVSVLSLVLLSFVLLIFLFKRAIFCKKGSINIRLFYEENLFNQEVLSLVPQLARNYTPPIWVRPSVVSTMLFGMLGRLGSRQTNPVGRRHRVNLPDGTAAVFDLFLDPVREDSLLADIILVVVPGFSNHSATDYVRAYTEYASSHGFRVATLDHLGSACGEAINPEVPRIHTYGGTGDLSAMIDYLRDTYPGKMFIGVGFSIGANILLKYLGERPERQAYFLGAQSWCQGYDAITCLRNIDQLGHSYRLFDYLITKKKKIELSPILDVLFENKASLTQNTEVSNGDTDQLVEASNVCETEVHSADNPALSVAEETKLERELPSWVPRYAHQKTGRDVLGDNPHRDVNGYLIEGWEHVPPFNMEEFNRHSGILMLDTNFTRPLLGFDTVEDMYHWGSCVRVLDQIRDFPVLLVNAKDDPIIPPNVVENIMNNHSRVNSRAIGLMTQHGGHLAFYEGVCCARQRVSWLDKVSILHARSLVQVQSADYTDRL